MDKCLNIKLHDLDQKQLGIHFEIQEMTIFTQRSIKNRVSSISSTIFSTMKQKQAFFKGKQLVEILLFCLMDVLKLP